MLTFLFFAYKTKFKANLLLIIQFEIYTVLSYEIFVNKIRIVIFNFSILNIDIKINIKISHIQINQNTNYITEDEIYTYKTRFVKNSKTINK